MHLVDCGILDALDFARRPPNHGGYGKRRNVKLTLVDGLELAQALIEGAHA